MCSRIAVVPGKGFEPPRPHRATDFESAASAISPPRRLDRHKHGTAWGRTAAGASPLQMINYSHRPNPRQQPTREMPPLTVARVPSLSTINRTHAPQRPLWDAYAGRIWPRSAPAGAGRRSTPAASWPSSRSSRSLSSGSRATVAGLALAALTCMRLGGVSAGLSRMRDELRAQPGKVLLLGTMAFVVTSSLSVSSQVFLPGSVAALLTGIGPLWIALGAFALGHAARPWYLLGGSLLACVGVGAVALGQDPGAEGGAWWQLLATADWRGVILALTLQPRHRGCHLGRTSHGGRARCRGDHRRRVLLGRPGPGAAGPRGRPRLPAPVRCQPLHPAHPRLPRPRQHRVQLCALVLCAQSAARHPHRPLPVSGGAAGGAVERTRLGRAADGEPGGVAVSPSSWVSSWRSAA